MNITTRTLNPLPFGHLEPSRFEDLVRQLTYGFRTWRSLEATGRSGSDAGFDIRGWEVVTNVEAEIDDPDSDHVWLIQCKREKAIGPKKLGQYFDDIPDEGKSALYGLVFAASCNLSKKSRDLLRQKCRDAGISECHVWSISEIEDMLFQPRNDHLLFAYFGISLKLRQRSARTRIRARLAAKRKAYSALGEEYRYANEFVLLRDPEEDRYPYLEKGTDRADHNWQVVCFVGHHALGMRFQTAKHYAFLDDDDKSWDMADEYNDVLRMGNDPWLESREQQRKISGEIHKFWYEQIDEAKRGYVTFEVIIPYDEILDIDKHGDNYFQNPHIYLVYDNHEYPYSHLTASLSISAVSEQVDGTYQIVKEPREIRLRSVRKHRIVVFPDNFRRTDK